MTRPLNFNGVYAQNSDVFRVKFAAFRVSPYATDDKQALNLKEDDDDKFVR